MEKEKVKLYSEDYYKVLEIVNNWPDWKKKYSNDCILIGKRVKRYL